MIRRSRPIAINALSFALLIVGSHAHSQDAGFFGLLRSRDLTPFGFVRLDMRPPHAVSTERGTWSFETEFAYQNTWALSPEVEKYLTSLEPTGRRRLGAAEVAAIRDLPGENYLLDLEQAVADVTVHYKFADDWAAYATFGVLSFEGGFLDSTIEHFHHDAGFSTFGRPAVARNDVNLIFDLKGAQSVMLGNLSTDGGLLDPVFGVRYSGFNFSPKWRLTVEGASKVPVQGRRPLLSSGRVDHGLQMSLQRLGTRNAFYGSVAAVYYAGVRQPAPQDSQVIPTVVIGWEFRLTSRTNLNIQGYYSESVYSHHQTDLEELLANKYQYSIGLRHLRGNLVYTVGFTENVQNVNNTPDVGFHFGLAYVPFHRSRRS